MLDCDAAANIEGRPVGGVDGREEVPDWERARRATHSGSGEGANVVGAWSLCERILSHIVLMLSPWYIFRGRRWSLAYL